MVTQVSDRGEKQRIARAILGALPDWFSVPESVERYVKECAEQPFFAAFESGEPVGFLCLKQTGRDTAELAVMGVLPECHRRGVGRALFEAGRDHAASAGYSFLQVKTVRMGMYPDYDATNRFYLSMGFREFEVFPTLWDELNPCQVYVMSLDAKSD